MVVEQANHTQLKELYDLVTRCASYFFTKKWQTVGDPSKLSEFGIFRLRQQTEDYGTAYGIMLGMYDSRGKVIELERELRLQLEKGIVVGGSSVDGLPRTLPDEWKIYRLHRYLEEDYVGGYIANRDMRGVSNRYIHLATLNEILNLPREWLKDPQKLRLIESIKSSDVEHLASILKQLDWRAGTLELLDDFV